LLRYNSQYTISTKDCKKLHLEDSDLQLNYWETAVSKPKKNKKKDNDTLLSIDEMNEEIKIFDPKE